MNLNIQDIKARNNPNIITSSKRHTQVSRNPQSKEAEKQNRSEGNWISCKCFFIIIDHFRWWKVKFLAFTSTSNFNDHKNATINENANKLKFYSQQITFRFSIIQIFKASKIKYIDDHLKCLNFLVCNWCQPKLQTLHTK